MRINSLSAGSVRQGTALVASMGLLVLVASTSYLMSTVLVSDYQTQGRRADEAGLLVTSESAANLAYQYFQDNSSNAAIMPSAGNVSTSFDSAIFPTGSVNGMWVHSSLKLLDDPTPGAWGDETYLLTASAISGDSSELSLGKYAGREVQMLLKAHPINFFKEGAFANNGYDWKGSAYTDSYNSTEGPYGAKIYANGDIASNGQLNVDNSGVHGQATSFANMFLPQVTYSPPASAPTVPASGSIGSGGYTFTVPGNYHTGSINIGKGDILRVQGGGTVTLYVDGAIYFNGAQLQFDNTQSTLVVYQNDYAGTTGSGFKLNGNTNFGQIVPNAGGTATQQSRPQQFQWYSMYTGAMDVNGTAQLSAVLYAPSATVKANGTFDWMGAIMVKSFFNDTGQGQVNGNFKFHFDESLKSLTPNFNPRLQVYGWFTRALSYDEIKALKP